MVRKKWSKIGHLNGRYRALLRSRKYKKMAAPLLRGLPLLRHRLHLHRNIIVTSLLTRRFWSTLSEPAPASDNISASLSAGQSISVLSGTDPPKHPRWDDPDFRKWKNKEAEILKDIEPVTSATKAILHSDRFFLLISSLITLNCWAAVFNYVVVVDNLHSLCFLFSFGKLLLFMIDRLSVYGFCSLNWRKRMQISGNWTFHSLV